MFQICGVREGSAPVVGARTCRWRSVRGERVGVRSRGEHVGEEGVTAWRRSTERSFGKRGKVTTVEPWSAGS